MEGIARRAGTAKTSLYRRWSGPEEVLLDAIAAAYPVEEPSVAADDLRGDLIRALELLLEWSRHPTAKAVQAIMAERHRYPELAKAHREVHGDPTSPARNAVLFAAAAESDDVPRLRALTPLLRAADPETVFEAELDMLVDAVRNRASRVSASGDR